jgi:hypothetical protein
MFRLAQNHVGRPDSSHVLNHMPGWKRSFVIPVCGNTVPMMMPAASTTGCQATNLATTAPTSRASATLTRLARCAT